MRTTNDYVSALRQAVGTRPLILPGTSVLVTDSRDEVPPLARADIRDGSLPGGITEPGESFEETGRRQVKEETGLTVGSLELLGVYSGASHDYRDPNGDVMRRTAAHLARLTEDALVGAELGGPAASGPATRAYDRDGHDRGHEDKRSWVLAAEATA
ncbi:NUDIX domain-containing protein [Streptomyces sp. NPDC015220]|uniref:NUDIX domain-containing protein n=1 Tax=Streptomyces sp. NPDC015220 TaxID=3364947 RepID=UPI0036FC773A